MTTYVEARDSLVTLINTSLTTDYPALKVIYENTVKVDMNSVGDMLVLISIDFLTARQATIETHPNSRVLGEITFRLIFKDGSGTRATLQLFDYLTALFNSKTIGGVTTRVPSPGKKQIIDEWSSFDLFVPFVFDSTS
jgi:hypothetical protein